MCTVWHLERTLMFVLISFCNKMPLWLAALKSLFVRCEQMRKLIPVGYKEASITILIAGYPIQLAYICIKPGIGLKQDTRWRNGVGSSRCDGWFELSCVTTRVTIISYPQHEKICKKVRGKLFCHSFDQDSECEIVSIIMQRGKWCYQKKMFKRVIVM